SASAWSASSSALPRHGCGGPQAPWPNQALHRTAKKKRAAGDLGRSAAHLNLLAALGIMAHDDF
ncbi:MAG: hypothetical protein L0312_33550, partial [Acidobacteria bacterium]|nr:hypothetical protein [Acidobacteriota bacterium]